MRLVIRRKDIAVKVGPVFCYVNNILLASFGTYTESVRKWHFEVFELIVQVLLFVSIQAISLRLFIIYIIPTYIKKLPKQLHTPYLLRANVYPQIIYFFQTEVYPSTLKAKFIENKRYTGCVSFIQLW